MKKKRRGPTREELAARLAAPWMADAVVAAGEDVDALAAELAAERPEDDDDELALEDDDDNPGAPGATRGGTT